jgi:hypothetical protein
MQVGFALLALMAADAMAQGQGKKAVPVGLVMGAGGTVTRDKQTGAIKPGEVLFAGDVVKAGATGVPFLFCPQKVSAVVAAGGQVVFEEKELSGAVENRKTVSACFLPAVQRLSVASQQHFGVMLTRAGSIPPPATTFEQRVQALPADRKSALEADLAAAKGDDLGMSAVRGAALERAGLLYDACEAYRAFSRTFDEAAWVKRKIIEIENQLMKEQK